VPTSERHEKLFLGSYVMTPSKRQAMVCRCKLRFANGEYGHMLLAWDMDKSLNMLQGVLQVQRLDADIVLSVGILTTGGTTVRLSPTGVKVAKNIFISSPNTIKTV